MNWVYDLQKAVDYMEQHLLEPIGYQDVARHIHMSLYQFHRHFSLMTGLTVNEYLRNRRLSLAGRELCGTEAKVLEVALKYGYESPESFTRAFTRFHGVTPASARKKQAKLTFFTPLLVKLIVEGGIAMDYRMEQRQALSFVAKVRLFSNEIIGQPDNREIADFWNECNGEGILGALEKMAPESPMYGLCAPLASDATQFRYGIAVAWGEGEVPAGYERWDVAAGLWAVFPCRGKTPDCIGRTWERIFSEFLPGSGYRMLESTDFELYPQEKESPYFCEIWVPVEKE